MNCVKNNKWKCVVPTFVGTLVIYSSKFKTLHFFFHRINEGKLEELNDNVLKENLKKIFKY
jgi:hypothetical protein